MSLSPKLRAVLAQLPEVQAASIARAYDQAIADAERYVAERVQAGARRLAPDDPQVAKNRAALEQALPGMDYWEAVIDAALRDAGVD